MRGGRGRKAHVRRAAGECRRRSWSTEGRILRLVRAAGTVLELLSRSSTKVILRIDCASAVGTRTKSRMRPAV